MIDSLSTDLSAYHIPVLMGGPGREREVSLRSGAAVAQALRRFGAKVTEVDVTDPDFPLPEDTSFVFNLIHGTYGEDGELQAELDHRGIRYTGEGAEGSRVAFDKILTKERFAAVGIPTVAYEILRQRDHFPEITPPCVVKAPRQGSSVGVHIIHHPSDFPAALEDCFSLDREVLVEEFFSGRELTVGVLGQEAMPVVEIVSKGEFYDYEHKYTKGGSDYFVPARISPEDTLRVQETALAAAASLGLSVYSRVDVMLGSHGELNVLEINTIPGMTETSLLPKAAAALGIDFPALCLRIANLSLNRYLHHEGP
jgi:D-alanine-D-alanine ligase